MARPMQDPNIRIDEILDAAEPLFFTKGYKKTTITDITSKMGVAKGMIIMGPLSRPRSKILRVAVSRIILSSEASKVKLVGNLVA